MASAPGACFPFLAAMIALPSVSTMRDSVDDRGSILPMMVSKAMDHERPLSSNRSHPTDSTGQVSSLLQAARSGGTCSQWQRGVCQQRGGQNYSFGEGTGNQDQCLHLCNEAGATCCSYEYWHQGSSTCYAFFSYEFAWYHDGSQRVPSSRPVAPPIFRAGGGSWYSTTCSHDQPGIPFSPQFTWEQKSAHLVHTWGHMQLKEQARKEWELKQQQEGAMARHTSAGQRSPRTERSPQAHTELHHLLPHGNTVYNQQPHSLLPVHVGRGEHQFHSLQPGNMLHGHYQDSSSASKPKKMPDSEPEDGYDRFSVTVRKTKTGPLSDPGIEAGFDGDVSQAAEIVVNKIKADGFIPDYNKRASQGTRKVRPKDIIYRVEVHGESFSGNARLIGAKIYEPDDCHMDIYLKRRKDQSGPGTMVQSSSGGGVMTGAASLRLQTLRQRAEQEGWQRFASASQPGKYVYYGRSGDDTRKTSYFVPDSDDELRALTAAFPEDSGKPKKRPRTRTPKDPSGPKDDEFDIQLVKASALPSMTDSGVDLQETASTGTAKSEDTYLEITKIKDAGYIPFHNEHLPEGPDGKPRTDWQVKEGDFIIAVFYADEKIVGGQSMNHALLSAQDGVQFTIRIKRGKSQDPTQVTPEQQVRPVTKAVPHQPPLGSGAQGETPQHKDVGDDHQTSGTATERSFRFQLDWMKREGWDDERANAEALERNNGDLNAVVGEWFMTYKPIRWGLLPPEERPPA